MDEKSKETVYKRMSEVLKKQKQERSFTELDFLCQQFKNYKFFKDLNIRWKDMIDICRNLDYEI